jgi:hypothetical protein
MLQQPGKKKNAGLIIFALMAVVGMFVLVPLVTRGCNSGPVMPALADNVKKTYLDFITSHAQAPGDFIEASFDAHDIVFVNNVISNNTFEVVRKTIPALYKKGLRAIGVDYLLADDQKDIDGLLTAETFNEARAKNLLGYSFMFFSYVDHLALFRDIWQQNRARPRGTEPLRVLGLGMKINRELYTSEAYRDRKDLRKANLNNMTQDEFMFSVVEREVIGKKIKTLLYVNTPFCLKNAVQKGIAGFYRDLDINYRGTLAMMVRERIGDRAYIVLFHNVWTLNESGSSLFPMGGVLDAAMKALPEAKAIAAFKVEESPCRDMPVSPEFKDVSDKPVPFKNICDAYLLNGPLYRYHALPLPKDIMTKAELTPVLLLQGVKQEDIDKRTAEEYLGQINEQIEKGNAEMAALPH